MVRTVLVLHAHPDDEVFATCAATRAASESGDHVELRIAAGGEAGERAATDTDITELQARQAHEARLTRGSRLHVVIPNITRDTLG
jgi:LmbE family N-acetylglucosaminyl deacetylase